jgi:hypothetical protein
VVIVTIIVNLFVLILLSFMLFSISRQGLIDLEGGMTGTIFFTSFIVLYMIVIFRMILHNVAAGNDHDSIKKFFAESNQQTFRGRPDRIVKAVSWLGTLAWGILVTTLAAVKEAAPGPEQIKLQETDFLSAAYSLIWNSIWVDYAYTLTILMTLVSATALYLKSKRNQRATDRYPPTLIAIFLISLLGSLYFY